MTSTTAPKEPAMTVNLRHPIRHMHPRQREALAGLNAPAASAVIGRAHLLQNLQGGILSGCLHRARADLVAVHGDIEALRDWSRRDNHAAMRSCGCSACTRDANRLDAR